MENRLLKILAIDDNEDNLISVKALIREAFPQALVLTATEAGNGIELARTENPDVILLDVVMPGMDGFEACQQLKSNPLTRCIPVVFLTALKGDKEARIRALEVGAEAFLCKPIDEVELTVQIRAMRKIKAASERERAEKENLTELVAARTRELELAHTATLNLLEDLRRENTARVESETHLRLLFENLPTGVVVHATDTAVLFANPEASRLMGLTLEQMQGKTAIDPVWCFLREDGGALPLEDYPINRLRTSRKSFAGQIIGIRLPGRSEPNWVQCSAYPQRDASGQISQVIVAFTDITERKLAEETARRARDFSETLIDSIPGTFYVLDECGRYVRWNAYQRDEIVGRSEEETAGFSASDTIHPDDREAIGASIANVLKNGTVETVEGRVLLHGGPAFRWLVMTGRRMVVDGKALLVGIGIDITEHKRAEEALRESEARFRGYIEHAPYGVFVADGQGHYVDVNPAAERITGYSAAQLTSMSISDLLTAESRERRQNEFQTLVATGWLATELGFQRADGSLGCWSVSAACLGPDRYLGFVEDITERKDSEGRMALLVRMLDEAPAAITIHDTKGQFLFSNRQSILVHGYASEEEFLSVNLHDLDAPGSAALMAERFQQIAERGEAHFEVMHRRKDGSTFPLDVTARAIEWRGQQAVLSIALDITGRKQAEAALWRSGEVLRAVLDNIPVRVFWKDRDLNYLGCNLAFARDAGFEDPERLAGLDDFALAWGEQAELYRRDDRKVIEDGTPKLLVEVPQTTPSGATIHLLTSKVPLRDARGIVTGVLGTYMDITEFKRAEEERKKLQEQFLQAQKMESVGRLAGGVAHDFNNLLMGIMGYTKLCQDGVAADHPVRQWLDEIMVETSRSADLVRQLLAFARKQVVARRNLDLNNQIGGTLKMLRRLIGERVELTWSPAAEPSIVNADSSQIDQILANLCVNATDAIANTGRIDIATRNLSMDASACAALPGMKPGDHVLLTVSDSGCGMDSETQAHAFEPFFTTKGVGQGTGLGLATVYGIVQQSDGFIGLDSTPGRGTTFSIYFPAVARAESPDAEAPDTGPLPGGKETILLVDDEKSIRVPTAAYLERLGYSVLTADSPEAAIHLAQEHPAVIDLLLSDMVMPGMSGVDLRNHLLSARPAMKSVFMTGYTTRQFDPCPGSAGETVCLMKPVPILDLAVAIRAALSPGSTGKQ